MAPSFRDSSGREGERTRYLFAALKNQLDPLETVSLILNVRQALRPQDKRVVGLCPSAASLAWAGAVRDGLVMVAQNCGWRAPYALTGELTVDDLKVFSVDFCLVGHSERRLHLGETEAIIAQRLAALLRGGVKPVLCVGETLAQKRDGQGLAAIQVQLKSLQWAFQTSQVTCDPARVIIAYEPMWAISTAHSPQIAQPQYVNTVHASIRAMLDNLFAAGFGASTSLLYGGGVDAQTAKSFFDAPEVDGALVGAAMHTPLGFLDLLNRFQNPA